MSHLPTHDRTDDGARPRLGLRAWLPGLLILVGLVVFVLTHLSEEERLVGIARRAQPIWLLLAAGVQACTYVFAGAVWQRVVVRAGERFRLRDLAALSVEKLTVDQVVPTGGLAGNFAVMRALAHRGLARPEALVAVVVDILSYYEAYVLVVLASLGLLWFHHDVEAWLAGLMTAFAAVAVAVPALIVWMIRHRDWRLPGRLSQIESLERTRNTLVEVDPAQLRDPALLVQTGLLQLCIFLTDATTLWVVMLATGHPAHWLATFVALVMGQIAGTIGLLPGGVGTFEAACTATLVLLGIPVAAALVGTLLLRAFTLWLPLLPGLVLLKREFAADEPDDDEPSPTRRRR